MSIVFTKIYYAKSVFLKFKYYVAIKAPCDNAIIYMWQQECII